MILILRGKTNKALYVTGPGGISGQELRGHELPITLSKAGVEAITFQVDETKTGYDILGATGWREWESTPQDLAKAFKRYAHEYLEPDPETPFLVYENRGRWKIFLPAGPAFKPVSHQSLFKASYRGEVGWHFMENYTGRTFPDLHTAAVAALEMTLEWNSHTDHERRVIEGWYNDCDWRLIDWTEI